MTCTLYKRLKKLGKKPSKYFEGRLTINWKEKERKKQPLPYRGISYRKAVNTYEKKKKAYKGH